MPELSLSDVQKLHSHGLTYLLAKNNVPKSEWGRLIRRIAELNSTKEKRFDASLWSFRNLPTPYMLMIPAEIIGGKEGEVAGLDASPIFGKTAVLQAKRREKPRSEISEIGAARFRGFEVIQRQDAAPVPQAHLFAPEKTYDMGWPRENDAGKNAGAEIAQENPARSKADENAFAAPVEKPTAAKLAPKNIVERPQNAVDEMKNELWNNMRERFGMAGGRTASVNGLGDEFEGMPAAEFERKFAIVGKELTDYFSYFLEGQSLSGMEMSRNVIERLISEQFENPIQTRRIADEFESAVKELNDKGFRISMR